ncbi:hypothetical protein Bbelb_367510 [Branchiostoma belcheri]|nr:hypothetical protein Bbelb_367510 [Branchiostoma belcheri]
MPEERLPRYLLDWKPNYGRRSRGRPRKSWNNCVLEDAVLIIGRPSTSLEELKELARDRKEWRGLLRKRRVLTGLIRKQPKTTKPPVLCACWGGDEVARWSEELRLFVSSGSRDLSGKIPSNDGKTDTNWTRTFPYFSQHLRNFGTDVQQVSDKSALWIRCSNELDREKGVTKPIRTLTDLQSNPGLVLTDNC